MREFFSALDGVAEEESCKRLRWLWLVVFWCFALLPICSLYLRQLRRNLVASAWLRSNGVTPCRSVFPKWSATVDLREIEKDEWLEGMT